MKQQNPKISEIMKAIKKTFLAVVLFGGILSTTSCGHISCYAYASNETDTKIEKAVEETTPEWAEATFVEELPSS